MLTDELFSKDELEGFSKKTSLITLSDFARVLQDNKDDTQSAAERLMSQFLRRLEFSTNFNIAEEYAKAYIFIGKSFELYAPSDNQTLRQSISDLLLNCLDSSIAKLQSCHKTDNTKDSVKACKQIDKLVARYQIDIKIINRYQKYRSVKKYVYEKDITDFFLRVKNNHIRQCDFDNSIAALTVMADDVNLDINTVRIEAYDSKEQPFNCDLAYITKHHVY